MIFAGERPDRFAASFWRHFFHMEHHAEGTAEAMIWFQKEFDWDFMKINPRADYHVQDWGVEIKYSHDELTKHKKVGFPVHSPDDWARIKELPPTAPALAEHLKVVSMIRKAVGKELPLLMTVFSPLSLAGRMVPDKQMLVDHAREHPDLLKPALEAITRTYVTYTEELRNAGADGLFFATTHWASEDRFTWEEYDEFGVPYDLRVMAATDSDAINLLHVCASNNYLKELSGLDYKCQMVNWDTSDPTNLPLDRAYELIPNMALVGGVDHTGWLLRSEPDEMAHFMSEIKKDHDPSRVIIGPGCAVEPETNLDNLRAIRERL
jgi:uroporphyrinogen decarboxylase